MSTPFISICIPAYKNTSYLERLLDSITIQTYQDFEVIITDDSPDDSVFKMVENYQAKLPITYYKNSPAAGMPANWNISILRASGSWIKMMHDDDWFAKPTALQQFADTALRTSASFIFSAYTDVYAPSKKKIEHQLEGWKKEMLYSNSLNLFYLNVIGHPSTIMHKKDVSILYDEHFKWVVDIDFYIRFLQQYQGFEYIDDAIINIGIDENQVSNDCYKNPQVEIPEYFTLLSKFPSDLPLKYEYVFHLVWNLVIRFKIKSLDEIKRTGYEGRLPAGLQEIITYQKQIPRLILKQPKWSEKFMKECFGKLERV